MNKMERPVMTVVRFGAEDVIATSSVARGGKFAAFGSEIKQFNEAGKTVTNYEFVGDDLEIMFAINISQDGNSVDVTDDSIVYATYAWYRTDSGWGWTTENRSVTSYASSGGHYPMD